MSTQLCEEPRSIKIQPRGSVESRSWEENMLQQRLYNMNKDPKNCPFIGNGASIPISTPVNSPRTAHTLIVVHLFQLVSVNPQ